MDNHKKTVSSETVFFGEPSPNFNDCVTHARAKYSILNFNNETI